MRADFVRTGRPASTPAVHGTVRLYVHGCRCELCRRAYADKQKDTRARLKAHKGDYYVSAELAREHLERLSKAGVGYRSVAEYTATQPGYICQIKSGKRKRIRQTTEERIMRVKPDLLADCATLSAEPTLELVKQINAVGVNKGRIALMLGCKCAALQIAPAGRVTMRTALKVKKLHKRIVDGREERMLELAKKARVA